MFRVGKMTFHHFLNPLEMSFCLHLKIHYCFSPQMKSFRRPCRERTTKKHFSKHENHNRKRGGDHTGSVDCIGARCCWRQRRRCTHCTSALKRLSRNFVLSLWHSDKKTTTATNSEAGRPRDASRARAHKQTFRKRMSPRKGIFN